jgi:hypothetical protein
MKLTQDNIVYDRGCFNIDKEGERQAFICWDFVGKHFPMVNVHRKLRFEISDHRMPNSVVFYLKRTKVPFDKFLTRWSQDQEFLCGFASGVFISMKKFLRPFRLSRNPKKFWVRITNPE